MLVFCEDCGQKYNIDDKRIENRNVKFACKKCSHTVSVNNKKTGGASSKNLPPSGKETITGDSPKTSSEKKSDVKGSTAAVSAKGVPAAGSKRKGISITAYILATLVIGFLVVSGVFAFLYLNYIPTIINQQIGLRTAAISTSFSGVVNTPLLLRNYLQVNKETQRTSKLPGVAYAAVVNSRGIVIAGFFSDLERFDRQFAADVKKTGFPLDVIAENKLVPGAQVANSRIKVGGQTIFEEVVALPDAGGEVHVGVYVSEADDALRNAIVSPMTLSLLGGTLLVGLFLFIFLTRAITRPLKELTEVANQVSRGKVDLAVRASGPREMRELANAFERMRFSIKIVMERFKK